MVSFYYDSGCSDFYFYGSDDVVIFQKSQSGYPLGHFGICSRNNDLYRFYEADARFDQHPILPIVLCSDENRQYGLFFVGIVLLYPLGYLVKLWKKKEVERYDASLQYYRRVAILVLLTITAHSFVEGLATFLSFLAAPLVAIPLVLSIIVHNFPEGMTIGALFNKISDSMNRRRAIFYSVIASLFEPIGALMAYIFILKYSNPVLTGILKAFLSGLLVATALNELIPNSQLKGKRKVSVQSIILGMFIMGIVLVSASIF